MSDEEPSLVEYLMLLPQGHRARRELRKLLAYFEEEDWSDEEAYFCSSELDSKEQTR